MSGIIGAVIMVAIISLVFGLTGNENKKRRTQSRAHYDTRATREADTRPQRQKQHKRKQQVPPLRVEPEPSVTPTQYEVVKPRVSVEESSVTVQRPQRIQPQVEVQSSELLSVGGIVNGIIWSQILGPRGGRRPL